MNALVGLVCGLVIGVSSGMKLASRNVQSRMRRYRSRPCFLYATLGGGMCAIQYLDDFTYEVVSRKELQPF